MPHHISVGICECLKCPLVVLRIYDTWRIECDGPLSVLDDGRGSARRERGVHLMRLTAEVRHATRDLAREFVGPRQRPHVRSRLEIPGCEVYRRRDVVGVRDVHVAPRQGVCLRVGTVKRVDMGKCGGSITEFPMKAEEISIDKTGLSGALAK